MAIQRMDQLITKLTDALFVAEYRRLDKMVEDLDQQNREAKGHNSYGFIYEGVQYTPKNSPYLPGGQRHTSLSFSLNKVAKDFKQSMEMVAHDRKMIEQVLYKLLVQCNDAREVRDCLPEALVSLVPDLQAMPRQFTDGYLLKSDERAYRQYQQILPKIQLYTATRLLY
jgi:hypothetical protein